MALRPPPRSYSGGLPHYDMDELSPPKPALVDLTRGNRGPFSLARAPATPQLGSGLDPERSGMGLSHDVPDFEGAEQALSQRGAAMSADPFDSLNEIRMRARQALTGLDAGFDKREEALKRMQPDRKTAIMALAAGMLKPTSHGEFGEAMGNALSTALPYRQEYMNQKRQREMGLASLDAERSQALLNANIGLAGVELPMAKLEHERALQKQYADEVGAIFGGEGSGGPGGAFDPGMIRRMAMLKARGGPDLLSAYKAMYPEMEFQLAGDRLLGLDPRSGTVRFDLPVGMTLAERARDALARAQYALEGAKFRDETGMEPPGVPDMGGARGLSVPGAEAPAAAQEPAGERPQRPAPPSVDFGGQPRQRPQAADQGVTLTEAERGLPPKDRRAAIKAAIEAKPAVTAGIRSARQTTNTVSTRVDNAINALEKADIPKNAILRKLAGLYPGSKTADVLADIETIKANLAKEAMDAFRAASKTGSTGFGALSEKELKVIESLVANLDTDTQSADQLVRNLKEIRTRFTDLEGALIEDYEKRYGAFPKADEERKSRFTIIR